MKMTMKQKTLFVFALMSMTLGATMTLADTAKKQGIAIGTGSIMALYYPTGSAICKLFNEGRSSDEGRCFTESTKGSIYNIRTIREGGLEFGIAQSDWVYNAARGISKFQNDGADEKLRVVYGLYTEPFALVARKDAAIKSVHDLKGKWVNLGNLGSGARETLETVMEAFSLSSKDFAEIHELSGDEIASLEKARVDRLLGDAEAYRQAIAIRAYVAEVEKRYATGDLDVTENELQTWKDWALVQADRLDPIQSARFVESMKDRENSFDKDDKDGGHNKLL